MYDHIIVPFDGTDSARATIFLGADFSKLFDAHLLVVTQTKFDAGGGLQQLKDRALSMSDELVDMWVEPSGSPQHAMATVLEHRPNSLVVMSTHGRVGANWVLKGSIAEAILRRIDTPVILTGPYYVGGDPVDIRQLLAFVDGTDTTDATVTLAASWARELGLPTTIVNIADDGPVPDLDALAKDLRDAAPKVETLRVIGPPVTDGIIDLMSQAGPSLAVMASHGRTGLSRLRQGSEIMNVVARSPMPVLIQKASALS